MGNENITEQCYGRIYLKTTKPFYFPGEQILGTVYLHMLLEGFPGEKLVLKVKGKEEFSMVNVGKNKKEYFCHKFPLYQGYLYPGQYAFPFSFVLEQKLPGSFNQKNDTCKSSIKYKAKAQLESQSPAIKSLKYFQELIVRETQCFSGPPFHQIQDTIPSCLCCCKRMIKISCVCDKINYLPGDEATLFIDVDTSQTNANITQFWIFLEYTVTRTLKNKVTLTESNFLVQKTIEGVPAKQSQQRITSTLQLSSLDEKGRQQLQPSVTGQIIQSIYKLRVIPVISGCSCHGTFYIELIVPVIQAIPITFMQVQQPPNWHPETFQLQTFVFDQQFQYMKNPAFEQSFYNQGKNPHLNSLQMKM